LSDKVQKRAGPAFGPGKKKKQQWQLHNCIT